MLSKIGLIAVCTTLSAGLLSFHAKLLDYVANVVIILELLINQVFVMNSNVVAKKDYQGQEYQRLPPWIQVEREAMKNWGALMTERGGNAAAHLLFILVSEMQKNNAVVVSHKALSELMGKSVDTVKRALKLLEKRNWIEVRRIGERGTVNAYIVNSRVAWTQARNHLKYSKFEATVVVSETEQANSEALQEPLKHIPDFLTTGPAGIERFKEAEAAEKAQQIKAQNVLVVKK